MADIRSKAIANGTYMKAPNGEKSNLNEAQWLHVRTKSFKEWFGDWERLAELENILNLNKNSNFVEIYEEYERKLQQEGLSSNAQELSSWSKELGESSKIYGALKESARNLQRRDDRTNEETRQILREELKKLAKEQGLWIDNLDAVLEDNFGAPINMGGEAIIYKGKDGTVVKSLSLDYYEGNPIEALERIIIHNHFFPETALTDIGFGQDADGTFKIIVAQPYIENAESATHAEIQQYITQELGFTTKDGNVYYGHGVKLNDLNPKNVLKKVDANGNTHYFVIDLEARDNTFNLESLQQEYQSLKSQVSQVVDKNGEPKIVYHGSDNYGFNTFSKSDDNQSYFFTDNLTVAKSYIHAFTNRFLSELEHWYDIEYDNVLTEESAKEYLDQLESMLRDELFKEIKESFNELKFKEVDGKRVIYLDEYRIGNRKQKIYSTFLNIKNPLQVNANNSQWDTIDFENDKVNTRKLHDIGLKRGNDGTIIENVEDIGNGFTFKEEIDADLRSAITFQAKPMPSTIYIAISSNQIKSATINLGTYSNEENDIRYAIESNEQTASTPQTSQQKDITTQALEHTIDVMGVHGHEVYNIADMKEEEVFNPNNQLASVNHDIDDNKKKEIRRYLKKINRTGRTLLYDGEGTMFLLDHADREDIINKTNEQDGFNCVLKFPVLGYTKKEIKKIKEAIEDGIIRDQESFDKWVKSNIRKQRSDLSHRINAQDRSSNGSNDSMDLQLPEGESIGGQSNQNSQINFGAGFMRRIPGNDGSNGPRYAIIKKTNNNTHFFIGNKAKTNYTKLLEEYRPDFTSKDIEQLLTFLHEFEDNKENNAFIKTAITWIANDPYMELPYDFVKIKQVFTIARNRHIDIGKYKSFYDLLFSDEMKPSERKIPNFNPDTEPTFINKRVEVHDGIEFTIYDIEDSPKGQEAVCKALAQHYTVSPWCLSTFTNTFKPTESAKKYWKQYDNLNRKIAYHGGKPVAFNSSKNNSSQYSFKGYPIQVVSSYDAEGNKVRKFYLKNNTNLLERLKLILSGEIQKSGKSLFKYQLTPKGEKYLTSVSLKDSWWDLLDQEEQSSLGKNIALSSDRLLDNKSPENISEYAQIYLDGIGIIIARNWGVERFKFYDYNDPNSLTMDIDKDSSITKFKEKGYIEEYKYGVFSLTSKGYDNLKIVSPNYFKTSKGEVYGFLDTNNNIGLDFSIISAEHAFHEYTHFWDPVG